MATDNNDPVYGGLEQRLMELERRVDFMEKVVARIEGTLEQMDKRLTTLEADLRDFRRSVEEDMKALRKEFGEKIDSNFKWTVGIILSTTVPTILMVLLTLLKVVGVL